MEGVCRFCGPPADVVTSCPGNSTTFECEVFRLTNAERRAEGLNELTYSGELAESAMMHATDLDRCGYFAHDSLDGTSFFQRCADQGYSGTCTGENIGGGQRTPEDVVQAWMDSPGHRRNILYPAHTQLGVAFHEGDGRYRRYWVQHFGRVR